ncbi:MAG: hypothetical protein DWQ37_10015 [Planctomycetota bacterium]|nr:MAG: hypothetical protein DWQ37_10015 [Planctomycetota bacterium]
MVANALLAALLTALPAASPDDSPSAHESGPSAFEQKTEMRDAQELRDAVHETLRRQATTEGAAQEAALRDLTDLYAELMGPTRLNAQQQLQFRGMVRSRLLRTAKRLKRELARAEANRDESDRDESDRDDADAPKSVELPPVWQAALAQVAGNLGGQAAGAAGGNVNPNIFFQGGAAAGRAAAGGTLAAQTAANAEQLIELIQTTIAPASWQVNGGQGTIMYFAPKQVLVIRQTGGVHNQLGQALGGLRGKKN